jgi:S-adenosylmethionine:tRNA ribosyltransferase-isomerase
MKTGDFSFELPGRLIAQYPPEKRGDSRLMVLDRLSGSRGHHLVRELPRLLEPGSLLVFNNSKVRKARLYCRSRATGAQAEFLLVKKNDERSWDVLARRAKRRPSGSRYVFTDAAGNEIAEAEISAEKGEFRTLCFDRPIDEAWLDTYGHIPLPPYIKREDEASDAERYQTVYASRPGSSAAPTAGLHFTAELLDRLAGAGIKSVFITLHVGLGTYFPVRVENIEDHVMHEESYSIDDESARHIERAKREGRKVVAVGTTSVRTLESAWRLPTDNGPGGLQRGGGSTSIFIYPGYQFKVVDSLFTNFHTPGSTLLMLVSAFAEAEPAGFMEKRETAAGRKFILESYAEAIRKDYRFFSYGDAMLIR